MSLPFDLDPAAVLAGLRLPPLPLTHLPFALPTSSAAAMAGQSVYPPSGGQETPRSEVDLDLALQLQELEINTLKDTVANQKDAIADHREGSKDLREAVKDLRDVIKNLRERNGDLQELNSHLSVKNAAHVDQRDKLQETKIELAELRDDHVELIDNNKREERRVDELNDKVKEQDDVIKDLRQQYSSLSTTYQKHSLYVSRVSAAYKAKDTACQELQNKHKELQVTYMTKTGEHSAAMNDLSASYEAKESELQELKDELQELRDYYKGHEELVEGLTTKTKQQDGIINGLKRHIDAVDSKQRFTIVELTAAIKAKDEALQTLKGEHEKLQVTYATTTSDHGAAMSHLSASCRAMEEELEELKELKDEYEEFQDRYIAETHENYVAINGLPEVYEARETELRELRDQLEELRDRSKADHELITDLTYENGQHDETIATLNAKVKEQDDALALSQQQVQGRDDTIAELKEQLAEAKKSEGVDADSIEAIQEYMRQLEEKKTEIEELQEQVLGGVSDKTARKLANKLMIKHKKRGETLKEVKRQVKAKDAYIKGLEGQVSNLESTIHRLDSKIDHLEDEYWKGVPWCV